MLAFLSSLLVLSQTVFAAQEPKRDDLDLIGTTAISTLLKQRPDLAANLQSLPGYAVITVSSTKIPGVGTAIGYGVVVDNRSTQKSYVKLTQFELGSGLGAEKAKYVILFKSERLLGSLAKGGWRLGTGADLTATAKDPNNTQQISSRSGKGYEVFKLTESGVLATITIRLLHARPYIPD